MQDKRTGEWTPQTVMMKLQRAALCVAWSPSEGKFAIGSGTKNVCVCSFNKQANWWAGHLIRKQHNSSVCCITWNPDDKRLATGSTDGYCRVFWASVSGAGPSHLMRCIIVLQLIGPGITGECLDSRYKR